MSNSQRSVSVISVDKTEDSGLVCYHQRPCFSILGRSFWMAVPWSCEPLGVVQCLQAHCLDLNPLCGMEATCNKMHLAYDKQIQVLAKIKALIQKLERRS